MIPLAHTALEADIAEFPAADSIDQTVDNDVVKPIDPAKRIEFWGLGHLETIITVLNSGDTKERLEQAVLTRQKHPRNNELLTLNEQGDLDVIRLRYESVLSLQALITELKGHNVKVDSIRTVRGPRQNVTGLTPPPPSSLPRARC